MSRPTEKRLHVPDDIVFDILTWLPVKSLIRFRCVSKSWYSTITNPIFITTHLNHNKAKKSPSIENNNNGYLLYACVPKEFSHRRELCTAVYNSDHTLTQISAFQIPFSGFDVVSFCNGVFCLTEHYDHIICLWNPSIRKFKTLAPHRRLIDYVDSSTLGLNSVTLGLAYNSQNNDFKILRLVCFYEIIEQEFNRVWIEAEIYTSSTDSWRTVEISVESLSRPTVLVHNPGKRCIFVNGALHSIVYVLDYYFILSFDVDDERFREIKLPQNYSGGLVEMFIQLEVYKGSLALIVFCYDPANMGCICLIWEMTEYGVAESWTWTKKNITMANFRSCYGCTDNGEILIEYANGLVLFDPESHQNFFVTKDARWADYTANSMESLVLLDGGKSVSEYKD